MERCPNCGATVRQGAKFCTTCGMRLPDMPATEAAPTPSSRSPFDSTSSVSSSRWPTERTGEAGAGDAATGYASGSAASNLTGSAEAAPAAPETEREAVKEPADVTETETATAPVAATDPESAAAPPSVADSQWQPSAPSSPWTNTWRTSSADTEAAEESDPEEAAPGASGLERPDEDESADEAATTDSETEIEPEAFEAMGEDEAVEPIAAVTEPAAGEIVATERAETAIARDQHDIEAPGEPAEDETDARAAPEEIELAPEDEEPEAAVAAVEPDVAAAGLDRANALLDELRGLLPQLASGAAGGTDVTEVVSGLTEARSSADEADGFYALRAALTAARERPRDIDTMLDIAGRLETISALHDAYLRLTSAVDEAVEKLNAENKDG